MRVAVAGSGYLAVCLLEPVLESSHQVVAVIQNGRKTRGLKRTLVLMGSASLAGESTVIGLAVRRRVPVVWIDQMDEAELGPLRAVSPDLVLVGGFDIILKRPLLGLPRIGCVNVHSSLLPKHRGPNPFTAVILANETETGVTFHIMDEGIDTGDILEQYAFPIEPRDTSMTVYGNACAAAGLHVVDVLDHIEKHGLQGQPQDRTLATYDQRPRKEDAYVDWNKPAVEIDRMARAFRPSPLARFRHRGRTITISLAEADPAPVEAAPGTVLAVRPVPRIATGQGALLILTAFTTAPVPWIWPSSWTRLRVGEKVG